MNKQKKQNLLTILIILLVMVLAILVGSIAYEEAINIKKQQIQDASASIEEKDEEESEDDEETEIETEQEVPDESENANDVEDETEKPIEDKEEYIGEEESNTPEETTLNVDEKAIDLVKKEWGEDDTVTFSIEKKNGAKYHVAVRDSSRNALQWYEVDTETWEVSEY